MKIGPSTIGAIVFTAVSVAAFGWMVQRPKVSGSAIGFAMPSSAGASSTMNSTSTDTPQATIDSNSVSATEEKKSETSNENSTDDASASVDKDSQISENQASTKTAAEEEKTTEPPSVNDEAQEDANATSSITQTEEARTAESKSEEAKTEELKSEEAKTEEVKNSPESTDNSTNEASTAPVTTEQSSDATTSSTNQADPATDSSTSPEQLSTEVASAPEKKGSTESATTNGSPAIQAVQLKSSDATMSAAVYTAATNNVKGTVVILHGCDYKPEGEDSVVRPLHEGLPQEGWNTLSLQLPNLSASSTYKNLEAIMPDAASRIESAIAMAKEKSQTPVVLFAHGCGAQVALAWMEVKGSDSIDAYIGLGTGVMNASADDASHVHLPLEKMKFPQLDIYGSADNESVIKTAPERLSYINRGANPASRQKIIEGADHNITGKGKELSAVIVKWLNGLAFKK